MLEQKLFEIRDEGTFIPALATAVSRDKDKDPHSHWLLGRAGYGKKRAVILTKLCGSETASDPYDWTNTRTMRFAHDYILTHWDELNSGDVIDVMYIMGIHDEPIESEWERYC